VTGEPIGIGIVGGSAGNGWAARAHFPALAKLDDFRVTALCTSRPESAVASAEELGVPVAVTDPAELVDHPDVDLVVVSVKVPHHRAIVMRALEAGKHVFCEWPLGATTEEALEMADAAARHDVRAMVGLQARVSPVVERMRELVAGGHVGRVTSATLTQTVASLGSGRVAARNAYTADSRNGANVLTIPGGHSLDALCHCLGEFAELSAKVMTQRPQALVAETGETIEVSSPDHVAVQGLLEGGALVCAQITGGAPRGPRFEMRVAGEEGTLVMRSESTPGSSGMQMGRLSLAGSRNGSAEWPLASDPPGERSGPHANVARLYRRLARAIRDGSPVDPSFGDAARRHRMLDAIVASSESGRVQRLDGAGAGAT
jgi:predicted dehydrogenase